MAGIGYLFKCLLSCVILLYSCEGTNLETLKSYCTFTNFCTEKNQNPFNGTDDVMPCCMNCSCDADCWTFDDCCPDVVHLKPVELQKAECIPLTVNTSYTTDESRKQRYRVIDFCPRDYDVKFVIDQCEERFNSNTDTLDVVAVSDSKYRIYKNRYCALCHGVTDVVSWNLVATDWRDDVTTLQLTTSDFQRTFLENYALESVPPAKLPMVHMICGGIIIDYCPASASTKQEEACRLGPYMLFFTTNDQGLPSIFKNVFCALCADEANVIVYMCNNSQIIIERSDIIPFTLVLDTSLSERVPEEKISPHCFPMEVYDYVKAKCMKLFCPPYSLISNGHCVKHVRLSHGGIMLRILYEPKGKLVISDYIHYYQEDEARKYAGRLLRQYGLKTQNILYFGISAIQDTTSNRIEFFLVEIILRLTEHYQLHDVARDVTTHVSRNHDAMIFINGTAIEVSGKLTFFEEWSFSDLQQDKQEQLPVLDVFSVTAMPNFVIGFFLCPYFVLSITEYNSMISREFGDTFPGNRTEISKFTYIRDGFFRLSKNNIAVCVDTYFGIFDKSGCSSRSVLFSQWLCIIMTLIRVWLDFPYM